MAHPRSHPCRTLTLSLILAFALPATAREHADEDETRLPSIIVSALGSSDEDGQVATPFSLIEGEDILKKGAATLGEALDGLPGVHSDNFGGGASRPVIRGQGAPRVKVLSDGAALLDASDISPDHAVTADPLLLQRVEVLRGPASLLYGSGAVGGVVNLLDDKIPSTLPDAGFEGRFALRANTVANERAGAAAMTRTLGSRVATHAEFSHRTAGDYAVPDLDPGHVAGSAAESTNAAFGLSWIGDFGYLGLAWSERRDGYGLPGHEHEYEACHPDGAMLHCAEHDSGHEGPHEAMDAPTVDLASHRLDLRGEADAPFSGIHRIRLRAAHTDYHHHEIEDGAVGTTFRNRGGEARIEIEHLPLGYWSGVFGVQHADTHFAVIGEEAFLPAVATHDTGVFLVEHLDPDPQWHFELGARHEWLRHRPHDDPRARPGYTRSANSFSGAAVWSFAPGYSLNVSLAQSERLPHAQELYARGLHLATNTWECGLLSAALTCGDPAEDASPRLETSRNAEFVLRRNVGRVGISFGTYVNHVADYIYARTLDRFEDFRLVKYSQRDATFKGMEAEIELALSPNWVFTAFADRVRAEFDDGSGNLPRIPPARIGARVRATRGDLDASLEYSRTAHQARIADFETRSPGYDMLNLSLDYRLGRYRQSSLFLHARNLLDAQAWNHASFLASTVPLPGRNLSFGLRHEF